MFQKIPLLSLLGIVLVCDVSCSSMLWSTPVPLNEDAATDTGSDEDPRLVTDGAGHWVAVWSASDGLMGDLGADYDILVARSADNGKTWTAPAALDANAATDSDDDAAPQIATDAAGHYVAVWHRHGALADAYDVLEARSSDNGATWSEPEPIYTNTSLVAGYNRWAQIATDGLGRWLAVWMSGANSQVAHGADTDLFYAASTDNGLTWTSPAALNTGANSDDAEDRQPSLATDGVGNWVCAWHSQAPGAHRKIHFARSTNGGDSWSVPTPLNSNAGSGTRRDEYVHLAGDATGHWVAVWLSTDDAVSGAPGGIRYATSSDGGASWSPLQTLGPGPNLHPGAGGLPQVATDGQGAWMVAWENAGNAQATQWDIAYARSKDAGASWTVPAILNRNANADTANDQRPHVVSDGQGLWLGIWQSADSAGGPLGTDRDLLMATLRLP